MQNSYIIPNRNVLILDFYIYAYIRPDGTPYYIGKGSKGRIWKKHHAVSVPKDKTRIVIMESGLTEVGALALERRYILWYGKMCDGSGILRNLQDGGSGCSGYKFTDQQRKNVSRGSYWFNDPIKSNQVRELLSKNMSGENNRMHSKNLTEEQKRIAKNRVSGEKNPMYGKMFINNGIINNVILRTEPIPDGWVKGDLPRKDTSKIGKYIRSEEQILNFIENNPSKTMFFSIIESKKTYSKSILSRIYPEFKQFY